MNTRFALSFFFKRRPVDNVRTQSSTPKLTQFYWNVKNSPNKHFVFGSYENCCFKFNLCCRVVVVHIKNKKSACLLGGRRVRYKKPIKLCNFTYFSLFRSILKLFSAFFSFWQRIIMTFSVSATVN